jgi:hypothetical protein
MALLAAGDLSDMVETVILLLVIGASVLGSIAKPLIKKFGGETPEDAMKRRTEQSQRPRPQPARPAHPAARPAQPRPPIATAEPARPVAQTPSIEPAIPPRVRPTTRPTPTRPIARARPAHARRPASEDVPYAEVSLEPDLSERHLRELQTRVEKRHIDAAKPSEEVVHPKTEDAHAYAIDHSAHEEELLAIRHPTRAFLRQAIVMNEILGPPIALRPPDDRA